MENTKINKNDFVEIEFNGLVENKIFDTTDKEKAKELGIETEVKPLIVSVGNEMLLKAFDEALEGKEINKKYSIHLTPDKAFGKRDKSLIKTIPIKIFHEKEINPKPGMSLQMDNYLVKILSVSGGRVITDFNNPLAGKEVEYEFKIKRLITDLKEKVDALMNFLFKQKFNYKINENKIIFEDNKLKPLLELFKDKFKKILSLDIDFEKPEVKKEEKVKDDKSNTIKPTQ